MMLVAVAFAAFFVTEIVKVVVAAREDVLQEWTKQVVALVVAFVMAGLWDLKVDGEVAVLALGAAGLAALAQKAHRFLSAAGDHQRVQVMLGGRRQSRL